MDNYFYRKLVFAKSKSSGTSNYADLSNKPQINGVELVGNKTSEDLGIEQGVTEEVLTQALAAESAAREKQDELLQGEIEGKIAAANILAGENIEVSQEGNNVTISSTAEGKTYTAGTNIEITEDNVINSTIPYNVTGLSTASSVALGDGAYALSSESVSIGKEARISSNDTAAVAIGRYARASQYSVSIGTRSAPTIVGAIAIGYSPNIPSNHGSIVIGSTVPASTSTLNASIVVGTNASSTKANQFTLGSSTAPINEMRVVTSTGEKYIATTDQTVPTGGTTGQVLMKNSDADYDFGWTSLADYDEVSF